MQLHENTRNYASIMQIHAYCTLDNLQKYATTFKYANICMNAHIESGLWWQQGAAYITSK